MEEDKEKLDKEIAEKFFGKYSPDELPSVERMIRALSIAKGNKFGIKPETLEKLKKGSGISKQWPSCSGQTDFSCVVCDTMNDHCTRCDMLDCIPPSMRDVD